MSSWGRRLGQRLRMFRSRHPALGTYGIVGTNVAVWGLYSAAPAAPQRRSWWPQGGAGGAARWSSWLPPRSFWERHFVTSYYDVVRRQRFETVPLCTFMHVDGYHLLFNMVTVFFFGRQLEQVLGLGRFLALYLASGTTAAATQLAVCGRRDQFVQVVGASGGAYALLAYMTCLMPWQTVYLYMIVPVPMCLLMAGLVAADVFLVRPGEAHAGHLAGVGCGAGYWLLRCARWRFRR